MAPVVFIPAFLVYILACRMVVRSLVGGVREAGFAGLNLLGVYWFCLYGQNDHFNAAFVLYIAIVSLQYIALHWFGNKPGWQPWLAFFTPIAVLVAVRYLPLCLGSAMSVALQKKLALPPAAYLIGISYLAFRSSHLVLEVRNGVVAKPGLWQYLGFCFFVPTLPVGPINAYSNFRRGFEGVSPEIPVGRAALRVLVGLVKYQFIGSILSRVTYEGFLLNEHPHHWMDVPVAAVAYYLFLYCNFSGFCDMAIGAAGLMGIPVSENFQNPLAARNVKDFWNRWHITLSTYMRDVLFSPLSKFLSRRLGSENVNHAIALTIFVVFFLIGIWHGVGWNCVALGFFHAVGVIANHYYTISLKKRLGREGFKAYNANRWIHAVAVCLTFTYITISLFIFANTFADMKTIFHSLR